VPRKPPLPVALYAVPFPLVLFVNKPVPWILISDSATGSGGFLGTYSYHLNRWLSVEGAYGYSQDTQKYLLTSDAFRIQSGIHQFTGTMILNLPSHPHSRLSPYVIIGGGALLFTPNGNQFNSLAGASSQAKGALVYGAGANYALTKAIALRVEYRGLVYSTPDFGFGGLATDGRSVFSLLSSKEFGFCACRSRKPTSTRVSLLLAVSAKIEVNFCLLR